MMQHSFKCIWSTLCDIGILQLFADAHKSIPVSIFRFFLDFRERDLVSLMLFQL